MKTRQKPVDFYKILFSGIESQKKWGKLDHQEF
jgi:hypothetical protein